MSVYNETFDRWKRRVDRPSIGIHAEFRASNREVGFEIDPQHLDRILIDHDRWLTEQGLQTSFTSNPRKGDPMTFKRYEFHEAANVFPMLEKEELQTLHDDIVKNDLQCPVELYEGKIIDGRNRYKACQLSEEGKKKFWFVEVSLNEIGNDPFAYVTSLNLHRRHLTASQRSMVAADLQKHYESLPKEKRPKGSSRKRAANALNVGEKSVADANRVKRDGDKGLADAVKNGELKVSRAAQIAKKPKSEQPKAIAKAKAKTPKSEPRSKLGEALKYLANRKTAATVEEVADKFELSAKGLKTTLRNIQLANGLNVFCDGDKVKVDKA